MLTIRNSHVDNYVSDKFVPLYHIGYFINDMERKLMVEYIYYIFYTFGRLNFIFLSFMNVFVSK